MRSQSVSRSAARRGGAPAAACALALLAASAVPAAAQQADLTPPETTVLINGATPATAYDAQVEIALTADDAGGSGLAYTEYRVDGAGWTDYGGPFTVSGDGAHTIDYRSVDAAGNSESTDRLMFRIGAAAGGGETTRPAAGGGGTTPPAAWGGDRTPGAEPAPAPRPWASVAEPRRSRATLRALLRGRMTVRIRCQGVDTGRLRLTVGRRRARRLGLPGRVLASRRIACEGGRAAVELQPRWNALRPLARRRRALPVRLALRFSAGAADRVHFRLRRGRGR